MATESNPHRGSGRHGHEKPDINAAWIFAIVACLALLLIALHFISSGLLGYLEKKQPPTDEWNAKTASATSSSPQFPRLQVPDPAPMARQECARGRAMPLGFGRTEQCEVLLPKGDGDNSPML